MKERDPWNDRSPSKPEACGCIGLAIAQQLSSSSGTCNLGLLPVLLAHARLSGEITLLQVHAGRKAHSYRLVRVLCYCFVVDTGTRTIFVRSCCIDSEQQMYLILWFVTCWTESCLPRCKTLDCKAATSTALIAFSKFELTDGIRLTLKDTKTYFLRRSYAL